MVAMEKLDPSMKKDVQRRQLKGRARLCMEGNSKVGEGRMEILEATPAKVPSNWIHSGPFAGHNVAEFALALRAVPRI